MLPLKSYGHKDWWRITHVMQNILHTYVIRGYIVKSGLNLL